ncbi:hypothetical protein AGMMS50225_18600 [Betaproteobacteria bacterium]|nr:hypothetical protein AGMMS50225_18600 [Betaproteobacteria bacterium]
MKAILMVCFLFFCGDALSCECSNALDERSAEAVFVGKLFYQSTWEFDYRVDENGEKLEGDAGKKMYGAILIQSYFNILEKELPNKGDFFGSISFNTIETDETGICGVRQKVGKKYKIYIKDYFSFWAGQAKRCELKVVPLEE